LSPALGLYIHWPYCARICPYCDFNVARHRGGDGKALAEAILADMARWRDLTGARPLSSIYFGGGTPSLMDPGLVSEMIAAARGHWPGAEDIEVTLEANPTDLSRFAAFAGAGVTRLSLGVQAFDDAALKFLGRNHSAAEARRGLEAAVKAFARVSVDLIYAWPGQTAAGWRAALTEAVAAGAEHISPYQLTIEEETSFGRRAGRGESLVQAEDDCATLYETTQEVLEAAGFEAYEVSNHARGAAARSRHNQIYWRGEDWIGVGPGAHGRITLPEGRMASLAPAAIGDYRAGKGFETSWLSPKEAATERLMMGLRTLEGLPLADLGPFAPAAEKLADLTDFVTARDGRLTATRRGRAVLDAVIAHLAPD
jgi:putative oxygen-independent coproporphyrinogen III oxidase